MSRWKVAAAIQTDFSQTRKDHPRGYKKQFFDGLVLLLSFAKNLRLNQATKNVQQFVYRLSYSRKGIRFLQCYLIQLAIINTYSVRSVLLGNQYNRTTVRTFTRDVDSFVRHLLDFFLNRRQFLWSNLVRNHFERQVVVSTYEIFYPHFRFRGDLLQSRKRRGMYQSSYTVFHLIDYLASLSWLAPRFCSHIRYFSLILR